MCGIFCSVVRTCGKDVLSQFDTTLIQRRGPDHFAAVDFAVHQRENDRQDLDKICTVHVFASVLRVRGIGSITKQPFADSSGNILAWNGELFAANSEEIPLGTPDTAFASQLLQNTNGDESRIIQLLSSFRGPFAFIYYCLANSRIYFGRDFFGRRSLNWQRDGDKLFVISSVLTGHLDSSHGEVPTSGLFFYDLRENSLHFVGPWTTSWLRVTLPLSPSGDVGGVPSYGGVPASQYASNSWSFPGMPELSTPESYFDHLLKENEIGMTVASLGRDLSESVRRRVQHAVNFCKNCNSPCSHPTMAVLFSGGLDSQLIAYYVAQHLHPALPIDLLNVVFYDDETKIDLAPDRMSGKHGYGVLSQTFPHRKWNFVEVDVPKEEMEAARTRCIWRLLLPQSSVLDSSIGTALWFASRATGTLNECPYTSPARILFSGLGADELFGGYSRHRTCFRQSNGDLKRLTQELDEDIQRIGTRNCGRDDRIVSDHGREVRYPFLDEDFVDFSTSLPVHQRCNLSLRRGIGDKLLLRLLAFDLGLHSIAFLEKRALQFGSRIAKIDGAKSGSVKLDLIRSIVED